MPVTKYNAFPPNPELRTGGVYRLNSQGKNMNEYFTYYAPRSVIIYLTSTTGHPGGYDNESVLNGRTYTEVTLQEVQHAL